MTTEGPAVWDQGLITCPVPVGEPRLRFAHFVLLPFPRLLPSLSHSNAGQRSVLLPILTWRTVPRRRCRGGELTVSFGGCRWGESGFFVNVTGTQSEVLMVLSSLVHRWPTQPAKDGTP